MDTENKINIDKSTMLIIFILIMFSSKLWVISFDIIKSLLYLSVIIYGINYLNPNISKNLKEIIINLFNFQSDDNIIKVALSKIASFIMNLLKPEFINKMQETTPPKDSLPGSKDNVNLNININPGSKNLDNQDSLNKNLGNIGSVNKNLDNAGLSNKNVDNFDLINKNLSNIVL